MFPLDLTALGGMLKGRNWCYYGCASFEPRWAGAIQRLSAEGLLPARGVVLFPRDRGSRWEEECRLIQEREWGTFAKGIGWGCERVDVDLVEAPVWERAAECMKVLVASGTCENVIVDISAMPKACFFPALKAALESNVEMVVVIYSEPKEYFSGTLEAEPIGITLLPGFEHLVAERDSPTGWIPILGFSGSFASTVYDALVDTYKFESRIFPMLGFRHSILPSLSAPFGMVAAYS